MLSTVFSESENHQPRKSVRVAKHHKAGLSATGTAPVGSRGSGTSREWVQSHRVQVPEDGLRGESTSREWSLGPKASSGWPWTLEQGLHLLH